MWYRFTRERDTRFTLQYRYRFTSERDARFILECGNDFFREKEVVFHVKDTGLLFTRGRDVRFARKRDALYFVHVKTELGRSSIARAKET